MKDAQVTQTQENGNRLITLFTGTIGALELYDANNNTVQGLLKETIKLVAKHSQISGDSMTLQSDGENFFLNQELLRLDLQSFQRAERLLAIIQKLGRNELDLRPNINTTGLQLFFSRLHDARKDPKTAHLLEDAVDTGVSLRWVEGTTQRGVENIDNRREAGARYFVTLQILTAEYVALTAQGKNPSLMAVRRTLQRLIDLIQIHRDFVLALASYGRFRDGLEGHIARTSMIAGCMAHALGLDRRAIARVCLHAFPALAPLAHLDELWSCPTRNQARDAYAKSVEFVLKSSNFNTSVVRDLVAHYEAEAAQTNGPPPFGDSLGVSVSGRIVLVAAFYDATRSDLVEGNRDRPISPTETVMRLESMLEKNNLPAGLESRLVSVLIDMMGHIPPGSLVKLETGAFAIARERPKVIQLTDTFGRYANTLRAIEVEKVVPLNPPLGLDIAPVLSWTESELTGNNES